MGWEKRGNKRFYYRKKRVGLRVVSKYMGTESSADLFSDLDIEVRAMHHITQTECANQRVEINKVDAELGHLDEIIYSLVRATLMVSGYHSYKGQWRKTHHA